MTTAGESKDCDMYLVSNFFARSEKNLLTFQPPRWTIAISCTYVKDRSFRRDLQCVLVYRATDPLRTQMQHHVKGCSSLIHSLVDDHEVVTKWSNRVFRLFVCRRFTEGNGEPRVSLLPISYSNPHACVRLSMRQVSGRRYLIEEWTK